MEKIVSLITFKNVIDLLLVAVIAYYVYRLLRRSGGVKLFWGIFAFVVAWFVTSYVFDLKLTGALFNQIVSVGVIAIIVIFQNEIRAFFYHVGTKMEESISWGKFRQQQTNQHIVLELEKAVVNMSHTKTGALIVITHAQDLSEYAETGETVDAAVSARLIENIFFKNTPLHDGALFVTEGRLRSAACILPVSGDKQLPSHYGLRHRAALGLTEKTDATAIVVSEETGHISLAEGDTIRIITDSELTEELKRLFLKK
ncbi:MAG: diadenylate cyclase CdaA [Bacteroidales bacterium]|nr:diadenylate cyclase CdaA [Bacteroidales bacterium]